MRDSIPFPINRLIQRRDDLNFNLINLRLIELIQILNIKLNNFNSSILNFNHLVIYSYLSVLLSIPEQLTPWGSKFSDSNLILKIKNFLLDFDDYLWQLNQNRDDRPLPSAYQPPPLPDTEKEEAGEEQSPGGIDSILGKEKRNNLIFLGIAGASVISVLSLV
jgi:hypothetical protein